MPDILTDAVAIIEALDAGEIERRIEWLEESLAVYRTLLVIKQIQARRPPELSLPDFQPLHTPLSDLDAYHSGGADKRRAPRRSAAEMLQLVGGLLRDGQPRSVPEIAAAIGANSGTVYNHLNRFRANHYRLDGKRWTLTSRAASEP